MFFVLFINIRLFFCNKSREFAIAVGETLRNLDMPLWLRLSPAFKHNNEKISDCSFVHLCLYIHISLYV